jgi:hypothetical protein
MKKFIYYAAVLVFGLASCSGGGIDLEPDSGTNPDHYWEQDFDEDTSFYGALPNDLSSSLTLDSCQVYCDGRFYETCDNISDVAWYLGYFLTEEHSILWKVDYYGFGYYGAGIVSNTDEERQSYNASYNSGQLELRNGLKFRIKRRDSGYQVESKAHNVPYGLHYDSYDDYWYMEEDGQNHTFTFVTYLSCSSETH